MRRCLFATLAALATLAAPARASVQIANYPDPQGAPGDVIPQAYLYIVQTNLAYGATRGAADGSQTAASGQVVAYIYRSAAAAGNPAAASVDRIAVELGAALVPANPNATPPVAAQFFPTLEQLAASAAQIQLQAPAPGLDPFSAFRQALYQALKAHPKLKGCTLTDVP